MGDNGNQVVVSEDTQQQQQQPPAFDIGAIFKTVQMLTQKVTSDLKPEGGTEGEQQNPPDIAQVFSSIGKVLGESSEEMEDVKKTFSNLGKAGAGAGAGAGGLPAGLNFGSILSSLMKPPQAPQQAPQQTSDNVHATHQDVNIPPEKALLPFAEKTVVLEVTENELNEGVIKKFTVNLAEHGEPDVLHERYRMFVVVLVVVLVVVS